MDCSEMRSRALAYIYGEMPLAERRSAEGHLAGCESCLAEVRGMSDMADLVGKVEQVVPSTEFHRRFDRLVTAEAAPARTRRASFRGPASSRALVAIAAGIAVLAWLRTEWAPIPSGTRLTLPPSCRIQVPLDLAWRDGADADLESLRDRVGLAVNATVDPESGVSEQQDTEGPTPSWSEACYTLGAGSDVLRWKLDPSASPRLDRDLEWIRGAIESMGADLGEG
ncbi:MAG: zf-HC2 domain-containing protein [Planctomycetes bacterium]|nr:zf-HC2 domain-containing protein [Planctomycetota bacterium]